jgi:hypothetical protein
MKEIDSLNVNRGPGAYGHEGLTGEYEGDDIGVSRRRIVKGSKTHYLRVRKHRAIEVRGLLRFFVEPQVRNNLLSYNRHGIPPVVTTSQLLIGKKKLYQPAFLAGSSGVCSLSMRRCMLLVCSTRATIPCRTAQPKKPEPCRE